MPNFKSISFKMAVLEGGGGAESALPMCVLSKDPMWNRVKRLEIGHSSFSW